VRHSTPRIITSQASLRKVNVENHLAAWLNIRVVHLFLRESWIEILATIRHRTDAQRLKSLYTNTNTLVISKFQPANIGLITRLLRTDIRE
jgi:hypothetical protein